MLTLFAAAALLVLLPLIVTFKIWRRYAKWITFQPPGQRAELTKASHGAGMLALSGLIVLLIDNEGGSVSSQPWVWVPLAVIAAWGALWFVTSGLAALRYGSQGPTDTVVLVRSLVKVAVGCTFVHFMPADMGRLLTLAWTASTGQVALFAWGYCAGWLVAMWCIFTGAAKVLLLLLAKIPRRRKKSPVASSAHGQADFAGAAEASRAMQGKGRRSKMEGVKF